MKFLDTAVNKVSNWSYLKQILVASILALLLKVPFILLTEQLLKQFGLDSIEILSADMQIPDITGWAFYTGVVLAPIFETLLAQTLPILLCQRLKFSTGATILTSASIFSLMHLPVIGFLPGAFIVGVILAIVFLARQKKYGKNDAYLTTAVVHSLHNLYAFILTAILPA